MPCADAVVGAPVGARVGSLVGASVGSGSLVTGSVGGAVGSGVGGRADGGGCGLPGRAAQDFGPDRDEGAKSETMCSGFFFVPCLRTYPVNFLRRLQNVSQAQQNLIFSGF